MVAAWRTAHPRRPLVLVLVLVLISTDLCRDIAVDAAAQASLAAAVALAVLDEGGVPGLPAEHHAWSHVVAEALRSGMPVIALRASTATSGCAARTTPACLP